MNSAENIELRVDLRLAELYWATLTMGLRVLRHLIGVIIGLTVLCAAGYFYLAFGGRMNDALGSMWYFIFTVLEGAVPATIVLIPLVAFVRARQVHRAGFSLTRRYRFQPMSIEVESPQVNVQAQWSAVQEVRETGKFVFLYFLPMMANVLPKRCFPSESVLKDFRAMIRANVRKTSLYV
jgi:hypothetical protein